MDKYKLIIIFFLIFLIPLSFSKVDPPNYNFSLDELALFTPGNTLKDVEQKYGKAEIFEKKTDTEIYRFYVAHIRYKFPLFLQVSKGVIVDFFAKLPSYFLHDVFHQSLINRIGKQDRYLKKENQAIYIWNNKNNLKHTYSGACTITCFPIYYSVQTLNSSVKFTPLVLEFNKKANFK